MVGLRHASIFILIRVPRPHSHLNMRTTIMLLPSCAAYACREVRSGRQLRGYSEGAPAAAPEARARPWALSRVRQMRMRMHFSSLLCHACTRTCHYIDYETVPWGAITHAFPAWKEVATTVSRCCSTLTSASGDHGHGMCHMHTSTESFTESLRCMRV